MEKDDYEYQDVSNILPPINWNNISNVGIEQCGDEKFCQVLSRNLRAYDNNKFFIESYNLYEEIKYKMYKIIISFPSDIINCIMEYDIVNTPLSCDFLNNETFSYLYGDHDTTYHFASEISNMSLDEVEKYEIDVYFQDNHEDYNDEKYFGIFKNGMYFYLKF